MSPRNAVAMLCFAVLGGCELVAGGLPDRVHPDSGTAGSASPGGNGSGGVASTDSGAGGSSGGQSGQGGSAGCKSQCDCDGDGAKSKACGGNDCDDHDPNAKPGQSAYFEVKNPTIGFDYNCDNKIERKPALDKQVNCTGVSLLNCDTSTQGYIGQLPSCGQSADWGTCTKGSVACQPDVYSQPVMACH